MLRHWARCTLCLAPCVVDPPFRAAEAGHDRLCQAQLVARPALLAALLAVPLPAMSPAITTCFCSLLLTGSLDGQRFEPSTRSIFPLLLSVRHHSLSLIYNQNRYKISLFFYYFLPHLRVRHHSLSLTPLMMILLLLFLQKQSLVRHHSLSLTPLLGACACFRLCGHLK